MYSYSCSMYFIARYIPNASIIYPLPVLARCGLQETLYNANVAIPIIKLQPSSYSKFINELFSPLRGEKNKNEREGNNKCNGLSLSTRLEYYYTPRLLPPTLRTWKKKARTYTQIRAHTDGFPVLRATRKMEIIVYRIVTMLNFILLNRDRYFCCVIVNLSKPPSSVFIMDWDRKKKIEISEIYQRIEIFEYYYLKVNKITIYYLLYSDSM